MNPTMLAGLALAFVGFALFAGTLFGGGGAAKSRQFAVVGEVLGGRQGPGRRLAMIAGLALMAFGAVATFAGVSAHDAGRADRCRAHCLQQGYTQSALGPSDGGGATYFACTCTRADGARTQTRADDL